MTIKDLMNLDISRLTNKTIQAIGHYAQVQVNKQVRRWETEEYKSPAYYALKKAGGKNGIYISYKDKTLNQKKKELARAIQFLSDPTRTKSGWKKVKQEVSADIKQKYDLTIAPENMDSVWTAYEKAKELNGTVGMTDYKYNVVEALNELVTDQPSRDLDELAVFITSNIDEKVKDREKEVETERKSISSNFK